MRVERRLGFVLLALASLGLGALAPRADEYDESTNPWCDEANKWNDESNDYGHHCVVREVRLGARDILMVDGAMNGSITVTGWDRNEIVMQVKIEAWADTDSEARATVEQVRLETGRDTFHAAGPEPKARSKHHDWQSWSASYRISVPRSSNLDLQTNNGGIKVSGVSGTIALAAQNGGIKLQKVSGKVRGRTMNGGLAVDLDGDRWRGEGLDLVTTNGSVALSIPKNYSAHLETGTTNGHMRVDFPVTVRGDMERRISADLGRGGATVRAITTNGAVVVKRGN